MFFRWSRVHLYTNHSRLAKVIDLYPWVENRSLNDMNKMRQHLIIQVRINEKVIHGFPMLKYLFYYDIHPKCSSLAKFVLGLMCTGCTLGVTDQNWHWRVIKTSSDMHEQPPCSLSHAHTRARMHTHAHTHSHAHTLTHTQAHTHIHTTKVLWIVSRVRQAQR